MTVVNAGKGLIAWDKWKDDPAAAAGEATFNIASIIIPAGAATAPVRTSASTAAAAIRTAAKIMDVIDPASALIKVGTAGARVAIPVISDLIKSVDLSKIDLGKLDAAVKIDIPDGPKIDAPKVEVPAVSRSDMTLDTPNTASTTEVPVRTVDTTATVPVREPALVGSGGDSVHIGGGGNPGSGGSGGVGGGAHIDGSGGVGDGGHIGGGHIGDGGHPGSGGSSGAGAGSDAPPTGGGGGTEGPTHGPAGSGHGAGNEWDPSQGDPVLSGADYGPGFTRIDELRGDPIDPDYGGPVANHGRLNDAYLPPKLDDIPQQVRELVTDPDAPFGRDAANRPYTREEWEARYVDENNELRYPGNDGAVATRRLDFTDVDEFKAHYGDILDRFGGENGKYFSPDGTPFEARALPPGSLGQPYVRMRLGELPPNWKIEVSEVAPAFGREGGGMQIRVLDNNGQAVTMAELRKQGSVQKIDDSRWPADHPRPKGITTPHYRDWNSGP